MRNNKPIKTQTEAPPIPFRLQMTKEQREHNDQWHHDQVNAKFEEARKQLYKMGRMMDKVWKAYEIMEVHMQCILSDREMDRREAVKNGRKSCKN